MRMLIICGLLMAVPFSFSYSAPLQVVALENGSFEAQLNGFRIHYEVRGSGPVCMVMPVSWGMSHEGMRGFLQGLEAHLTMVYFDPRGLGRSEAVRGESDRSMANIRADFDALRQLLGLERVILLGWSNSGMNAMRYAEEHAGAVSRLILLHTLHKMLPEWKQGMSDYAAEMREQMQGKSEAELDGMMREMMTEQWPAAMIHNAGVRDAYLEFIAGADVSWHSYLYMVEHDAPGIEDADPQRLTMPALLVAGRHDELTPELMGGMHAELPNSTFIVLENSAHFGPIEDPEAFIDAVRRFLGKDPAADD